MFLLIIRLLEYCLLSSNHHFHVFRY